MPVIKKGDLVICKEGAQFHDKNRALKKSSIYRVLESDGNYCRINCKSPEFWYLEVRFVKLNSKLAEILYG